nr:unnamed protein product [Callosobruchus chinensis]
MVLYTKKSISTRISEIVLLIVFPITPLMTDWGAARGAAQGFQTLLGSGSRLATTYAQGSSAGLG